MKCTVVSYSLSSDPTTILEWKDALLREIVSFINSGSEIILYPELFLMGTFKYLGNDYQKISQFIMDDLLPSIEDTLRNEKVLLILGSGPIVRNGKIYNSAPVFCNGSWIFQDKLFLTPWETEFTAGDELQIFKFKDLRTAVVICFDSEQPDLTLLLKKEGIDLVMVPAATTNRNGSNRVNRCASSRAIELGAFVMTCPLVGDSSCELVDHNEGRQGLFLPAQEDILGEQELLSPYSFAEKYIGHYELDISSLRKIKIHNDETKPYHKAPHPFLRLKYE